MSGRRSKRVIRYPWWTEGGAWYSMDRRYGRAMMRAIKKARIRLAHLRVSRLQGWTMLDLKNFTIDISAEEITVPVDVTR